MRDDEMMLIELPTWTVTAASILLWAVVLVLAVTGVWMLSVHGDVGAVLLVAALIMAAPAAAMSQRSNSV